MYQATITNEDINVLPLATFGGQIVVVDTPEAMAEAAEVLGKQTIIGYDTETRPSFQKGRNYKVALLQLSTGEVAYLFRLNIIKLSDEMIKVLESAKILKIGAAIRDDIKTMQKHRPFKPAGFIDLQSVIGKYGIEELSVKKMSAIVLGVRVSKAQRLSNWEAANLTESQQHYAAVDAWICRQIYTKLIANK